LALAGWLIYLRPEFHARSDKPSIRQGLTAVLAGALFTLVYGTVGFYILDRHFNVFFSLPAALRQTILMFTSFYDPGLEPLTGFGRYFAGSIYFIGLLTFAYAALMLLRPVLIRQPATPQERQRAGEIVAAYGRTTLAPFALFEDKSYFFSSGGSLINFVLEGGVALTLGDPIGPSEDAPAAIHEFCQLGESNAWQPAFYQVLPDFLPAYHAAGFQQVCIGQEALIDLDLFTLEGAENKSLRTAWNKLTKSGYHTQVLPPPQPQPVLDELRHISDAWLALVHGVEKRFSLGWFLDEYIRACPIMVVSDPQGCTVSFANILSEYQHNEATIDMMRHLPEAPNGTMDFLFVSLFKWAKEQGYNTFNLGLSSLAGVGESPRDPAIEHALHYIYEHINQFYNFKGLHHFKEKFQPLWSPRYLIYRDMASLPLVTLAMIRADSGGSLLHSLVKR
jgi:phosphatidylglycerol lysyltransferase